MGLETGTQIQDLNPAWPLGSDDVSQGDDHLRLIKECLQGSFPGMTDSWKGAGIDMDIKSANFNTSMATPNIESNRQVCSALGIIDGTSATFKAGTDTYGVSGVTRTPGESVGSYTVTLHEAPGANTVGAGSAFYIVLGEFTVQVLPTAGNDVVVQCRATSNGNLADADNISFFVIDAGR